MRLTLLLIVAAIATPSVLLASPPADISAPTPAVSEAFTEEVAELRSDFETPDGTHSVLRGSDEELAGAIQRMQHATEVKAPKSEPAPWSEVRPPGQYLPATHSQPQQPIGWGGQHPQSQSWGPVFSQADQKPKATPKHLLLETAFRLEGLAHRLEMEALTEQADSLRDAANRIRQSARMMKGDGEMGDPGPLPNGGPTPAGQPHFPVPQQDAPPQPIRNPEPK